MLRETFTLQDVESFGKNGCFAASFRFSVKSACGDCMVVTALSRYEGETAPRIRFFLIRDGAKEPIYESHRYPIGRRGEPTRQQWRVPPMFHPALHAEIEVLIPEGTKLTLTQFGNSYGNPGRWNDIGVRYNAHLGFRGAAPANTRPAVELAAQCGFSTCIINPKEIGDGELVCIHNPTIEKYARDAQGNVADDHRRIYEMTYPEINRWDYGIRKDEIFRGAGILKLEDYFEICSKTGMKPMFSAHENSVRSSGWKRIAEMLQKFGLTKYLHVKAPRMDELELAYSFFGDRIDGYTLDSYDPEKMKNSVLADAKCRRVIEVQPHMYKSKDDVQRVLDLGFSAAAFPHARCDMETYRRLIDWGVTEFTEDYHCSMGLNW